MSTKGSEPDFRELFKRSLAKITELKARLAASAPPPPAPVAIIGMGCRFPGGAVDPEAYWQALHNGVDGVSAIPAARWPADAVAGEDPGVRWAGLLPAVDGFDAVFFGISPREAESLDPQQRLLLEVVWEALERAGQRPDGLAGSRTGVFVGLCSLDYRHLVLNKAPSELTVYDCTGNLPSTAAGRVSYQLGLQGPCLSIDTACSSSLVAVHTACQSLRSGESELAIAGGVNVIVDPTTMRLVARLTALSPEGRCKVFDAGANGFVRGEGCGVVILKRLPDALRDRDPILAVIRGSAVNQDGRSTGLTAPNVLAQQELLQKALSQAQVAAAELGYIETHGTGTPLGDPIEVEALQSVFGAPRADGSACILGAVKSNIGHLEAAAGIAGLIKAVLCLAHEEVPANLHFRALNPRIDLSGTPLVIAKESLPWHRGSKPRISGVSAFGLSGTNAHIILEEPPPGTAPSNAAPPGRPQLLVLSGQSAAALRAQALQYVEHLQAHGEQHLADIAYTASVRRSHQPQRLAAVGSTGEKWREQLQSFLAGRESAGLIQGSAEAQPEPRLVFVFPAPTESDRWLAMGRELLAHSEVFRSQVRDCDRELRPHCGWSLLAVLEGQEPPAALEPAQVLLPLRFALQVGLSAHLRSLGIVPAALLGYGAGEVAAAQVAGWLTLAEACQLIGQSSRLPDAAGRAEAAAAAGVPASAAGRREQTPLYSQSGGRLDQTTLEPGYWYRRLTEPASTLIPAAAQALAADGLDTLIELGPQPSVRPAVTAAADRPEAPAAAPGASPEPCGTIRALLTVVGTLYVRGYPLDWAKQHPAAGQVVTLPTYPWQRRRHWVAPAAAASAPSLPDRFYAPAWRLRPLPVRAPAARPGTWVLLLDEHGLGEQLARELETAGAACLRVRRPPSPDPAAAPPSWTEKLNDAEVQGVVDLWSLDADGDIDQATACRHDLERTASYLRSLASRASGPALPVWLVTRGAMAVAPGEPVVSVAQAALWGLGRVASLEHPELRLGLVDLPQADAAAQLSALAAQLLTPDGEDQVALRVAGRCVQRLERRALRPAAWRTHGTALITGGLGALGLQLAKWVTACGAEHVVLLSRGGLQARGAADAVAALQAHGVALTVIAADVSDPTAMTAALTHIDAHLPPLRSVIHAAGVAVTAPLTALDREHFERALRPKVAGTLVLEALLRGRQLDAVVCFSSLSAVWGGPHLGAYAAANAFEDAWAHAQRAQGRTAVSINWGPWAGGGMATDGFIEALASRGLKALSPESSLHALEQVLADGTAAQMAIAEVDWPQFRSIYESQRQRPLLEELGGDRPPVPPPASADAWQAPLHALSPEQRRAQVEAAVRDAVAGVLKLPGAEVPADRPMRELGMDSLMAAELRKHLALPGGDRLPATLVYDYPTVDKLSEYLLSKLAAPPVPSAQPAPSVEPPRTGHEPVAVIGIGCRFPGGVSTPEELWQLLLRGDDAITEVPAARWDVEAYYDPDPDKPGKMYGRWGGFVSDVEQFDAGFFGISPREAISMDPQQRLLLEVGWEALEQAGQLPAELAGSATGVFLGVTANEYGIGLASRPEAQGTEAYVATGNMNSIAAGRLSYLLGLSGPAMVVDTACSSSLVAVHLACQSLRSGECNLALAGGVNLILSPDGMIAVSRLRALSPEGRCKTFDASADGMVRSEGCGIVVLKRLADAERDGDPILAVIRGTAINQDGRSNGLTAPNGLAQQAVIRSALRQAGVAGGEVGYVEAHGTGTALGDPIELHALGAVLEEGRPPGSPAIIGTLKTNLGHTEAAAGVAGLIKAVLVLQHGRIPANLHFHTPSPHITWQTLPVIVPTAVTEWPGAPARRVAGVSAFGFSGTNAHVVLTNAPQPLPDPARSFELPQNILPLSARSQEGLRAQVRQYAEHLAAHPEQSLAEVCHSAATARTHFAERLVVIADSAAEARLKLRAVVQGESPAGIEHGHAEPARRRKLAFLFTGQGSQYVGMGYELYQTQPVFRAALKRCAAILAPLLERPLLSVLYPDSESDGSALIHETAYTQPALFAVEYALSELWRSCGIKPDAVIGHSIGEYAAACVAGVIELEDALRLVAARGRMMQALPRDGAMASVRTDPERVLRALHGLAEQVSIAAVNAPDQTVIAGRSATVQAVCTALEREGVKTTRLAISHAAHSPLMEPMLADFEEAAAAIRMKAPAIAMVSNLTGAVVHEEVTHAAYWRRHVREPVRFAHGARALKQLGIDMFIELGPQPTLLGLAMACLGQDGNHWLASLRKGKGDWGVFLESLGHLWVGGAAIDFKSFAAPYGRQRVPVPTYPWQRERYWLAPAPPPSRSQPLASRAGKHPLSGQALALPGQERHQVLELGFTKQTYLADHVVYENVVVPGAFYLAVVLAIAVDRLGAAAVTLREVHFISPLWLKQDTNLHVVLRPSGENQYSFRVLTPDDAAGPGEQGFREHAEGILILGAAAAAPVPDMGDPAEESLTACSPQQYLERIAELRIRWGPQWRRTAELHIGSQSCRARLGPLEPTFQGEGPLAPVILDNAFAATLSPLLDALTRTDGVAYLPWSLKELRWYCPPTKWTACHSRLKRSAVGSEKTVSGDLILVNEQGQVVAMVDDFIARRAPEHAFLHPEANAVNRWLYALEWRRTALGQEPTDKLRPGRWLLIGRPGALATALAAALKSHGATAVWVQPGETFGRVDGQGYQINPADPQSYQTLLSEVAHTEGGCAGIIHLGGLESTAIANLTPESLERDQKLGSLSALYLVQALMKSGWRELPRLWFVTAGTQVVDGDQGGVSLSQTPLWGLGQAIAAEHPELLCTRIDVRSPPTAADGAALAQELLSGSGEQQVVLRGGERYVARLAYGSLKGPEAATPHEPAIAPEGAYLISGGLGGLGLAAAELLAAKGAGHLVLIGRSPPGESAERTLCRLRQSGAQVTTVQVDVADAAALLPVMAQFGRSWPPLKGILHAAAVVDDGILLEQTAERFRRVMAPKVLGGWNLHLLSQGQPLDFFVCYSSAASLLGLPGQGNYVAANTFLDALAAHRRQLGLCGVSINWGPFAEVGLAARSQHAGNRLAQYGIAAMTVAEGGRALLQVLGQPWAQVGVMKLDPKRLFAAMAVLAGSPYFAELLDALAVQKPKGSSAIEPIKVQLGKAESAAWPALVQKHLGARLSRVLRLPAEKLESHVPLTNLGMDSLMALELRNQLSSDLQLMVPISLLLGGTTVEKLAAYIIEQLTRLAHAEASPDGLEEGAI